MAATRQLIQATRDAGWPRIPVAHLSCETDAHFSAIHCRRV
jgi:hypothetical protein